MRYVLDAGILVGAVGVLAFWFGVDVPQPLKGLAMFAGGASLLARTFADRT